jgi:hypothetical protein
VHLFVGAPSAGRLLTHKLSWTVGLLASGRVAYLHINFLIHNAELVVAVYELNTKCIASCNVDGILCDHLFIPLGFFLNELLQTTLFQHDLLNDELTRESSPFLYEVNVEL